MSSRRKTVATEVRALILPVYCGTSRHLPTMVRETLDAYQSQLLWLAAEVKRERARSRAQKTKASRLPTVRTTEEGAAAFNGAVVVFDRDGKVDAEATRAATAVATLLVRP